MAKTDYQKHYKLFKKFKGTLRRYCDTRRPKLLHDPTKSAFKRIKKRVEDGSLDLSKPDPKMTPRGDKKDIPKTSKKTAGGNLKRPPKKRLIKAIALNEPIVLKLISVKHQAVVDGYLKCMNKAESYQNIYKRCKYQTALKNVKILFKRPEVKEYLEYQRSLSRAKVQVDLQWINNRRKQIAETELSDIAEFGSGYLNLKESDEIPKKHRLSIRKLTIKKKYKMVPTDDGESMEEIIEVEHGVELEDRQKAMNDLEKSLISVNHDVSAQSTHEEVRDAWALFIRKEIGAIDFCYTLEKLQCKVPEVIRTQALAEINVLKDEGMLVIKEAIPMLDGQEFAVDEQLKVVIKRAAEQGNVPDMMSALKTLAAMKIVKTSFNFSLFSKFARMGFDGEVIESGNENLIEAEAQKWEE